MPESVRLPVSAVHERRENVIVTAAIAAASARPLPHAPKYDPSLLNRDVRYVCIGSEVVVVVVDDVTPFACNIYIYFFFSFIIVIFTSRAV